MRLCARRPSSRRRPRRSSRRTTPASGRACGVRGRAGVCECVRCYVYTALPGNSGYRSATSSNVRFAMCMCIYRLLQRGQSRTTLAQLAQDARRAPAHLGMCMHMRMHMHMHMHMCMCMHMCICDMHVYMCEMCVHAQHAQGACRAPAHQRCAVSEGCRRKRHLVRVRVGAQLWVRVRVRGSGSARGRDRVGLELGQGLGLGLGRAPRAHRPGHSARPRPCGAGRRPSRA